MPGDELLSCALSGVILMQWHEKYIGIPFENGGRSFLGCDCGGLVLLMLKTERGIHAKDMLEVYERQELHTRDGQERLSHMIGDSLSEWVLLPKGTEPKPLDMALYRYRGADCHCAAVVDARHIIHVEETRPSRLAPHKMLGTGYQHVGIYRHVALE